MLALTEMYRGKIWCLASWCYDHSYSPSSKRTVFSLYYDFIAFYRNTLVSDLCSLCFALYYYVYAFFFQNVRYILLYVYTTICWQIWQFYCRSSTFGSFRKWRLFTVLPMFRNYFPVFRLKWTFLLNCYDLRDNTIGELCYQLQKVVTGSSLPNHTFKGKLYLHILDLQNIVIDDVVGWEIWWGSPRGNKFTRWSLW